MILLALSQQNLRTYCVRPLNYVPDTFYRPSESSTVHSRERLSRWKNGEMYSFIEWYTYHIDTLYTYDFWPITGDDSFHHFQCIFFAFKKFIKRIWLFFGAFFREVHSAHQCFSCSWIYWNLFQVHKSPARPSSPPLLLSVTSRQIFLHSNWTTVEPWQQQQQWKKYEIYKNKNKINTHKAKQIKKTVYVVSFHWVNCVFYILNNEKMQMKCQHETSSNAKLCCCWMLMFLLSYFSRLCIWLHGHKKSSTLAE